MFRRSFVGRYVPIHAVSGQRLLTPAADLLVAKAKARSFTSPYWLTQREMSRFDTFLQEVETAHGVEIESPFLTGPVRLMLYNAQQTTAPHLVRPP